MSSKYETHSHISKEFIEFLEWCRINDNKGLSPDEIFTKYQFEKDISFHGDLRKLHGANTRNANKELLMAIGAAATGITVAVLIIHFDIFDKLVKFISHLIG